MNAHQLALAFGETQGVGHGISPFAQGLTHPGSARLTGLASHRTRPSSPIPVVPVRDHLAAAEAGPCLDTGRPAGLLAAAEAGTDLERGRSAGLFEQQRFLLFGQFALEQGRDAPTRASLVAGSFNGDPEGIDLAFVQVEPPGESDDRLAGGHVLALGDPLGRVGAHDPDSLPCGSVLGLDGRCGEDRGACCDADPLADSGEHGIYH